MDDLLRIAICEDTRADEEKLLDLLARNSIPSTCSVFHSGEELLRVYQPGRFDLLLSDIYMGGISGVELVTRIRAVDETLPVAFVTTSADHALESYRLNVLKYIEKPYQERDVTAILRLALLEKNSAPALTIHKNGREQRLPLSQILYLEQQTHQLNVYLKDGSVEQLREKLAVILPQLEENGFFQPHKSFAVNLSFVRSIDTELRCFVMQNEKNIPIRRESLSQSRQALKSFLFRRTRGGRP